ncbi:hypothetical protein B0H16DRAFT_1574927 [Mycena metata]|uniref:BTB domain-containing protein n=1 Tax=Mycena metata TaxID=1033252 RepID=A0AAD7MX59_9AGAR|nr:hypothetical protein B0H16DRAFT_1574927 [Mycena metata]
MSCASFSSMDVVAEDSFDDTPLVKRRRVSDSTRSCEATRSHCSISKNWWHSDGDIVLEIETRLLKVHRKRLQCSIIFSDMLHIPQPSETDQIDGCPSVVLVGDSLADWEVTLKWLYHNDDFSRQAITFDLVAGALRISTKYEIPWSASVGLSQKAITLAQECNVPEILPSCFYALSVQKFHSCADGGRSHIVLSPNDLRRLIAGREALQDALVRIIIDPLTEPGCYNNESCGQCAPRRLEYWRMRLAPDAKSPWSTWLTRELDQMLRDEAFISTLCSDCVHGHLSTIRWRLGRLRGAIPAFFLL